MNLLEILDRLDFKTDDIYNLIQNTKTNIFRRILNDAVFKERSMKLHFSLHMAYSLKCNHTQLDSTDINNYLLDIKENVIKKKLNLPD